MREPKNQDVFIKAEESRKQDDQGIMVWLVTQHEDLLDSAVVDEVNDLKLEEDQDDDKAATKGADLEEGSEDLRSLLEKFRVEHRDVQVSMEENEEKLKVCIRDYNDSLSMLTKTGLPSTPSVYVFPDRCIPPKAA